ncbi:MULTISPECIES: hypothetical protein [unclassified Kitasatospora]|uniref:hypothetical protein n=1 Tax=unclassified Kitasatospora TaxID=2633591 RepID=UPI0033CEF76E
MSVSAAFRSAVPDVRRRSRTLRAALSRGLQRVLERLAASPLDNSVLGAIGAPRPPRPHTASRPDGSPRRLDPTVHTAMPYPDGPSGAGAAPTPDGRPVPA